MPAFHAIRRVAERGIGGLLGRIGVIRRVIAGLVRTAVCAAGLQFSGCLDAGAPLELSTLEPSPAQAKIAEYHFREAAMMHQKSEELLERARLYEGLFGADSDWVSGSRLLAQSYEEDARSLTDLGQKHLRLADERARRR
jgi:hypothetical protein